MKENESETEKQNTPDFRKNMEYLILYSLAYVVALGINELAKSIFDKFEIKSAIMAKLIYVISIIGITILCVYLFKADLKQNT